MKWFRCKSWAHDEHSSERPENVIAFRLDGVLWVESCPGTTSLRVKLVDGEMFCVGGDDATALNGELALLGVGLLPAA